MKIADTLRKIVLLLLFLVFLHNIFLMYLHVFDNEKYPVILGYGNYSAVKKDDSLGYSSGDWIGTLKQNSYAVGDVVLYENVRREIVLGQIDHFDQDSIYLMTNREMVVIFATSIRGKCCFSIPFVGPLVLWAESPLGTVVILVLSVIFWEAPALWEYIRRQKKANVKRY